MKKELLLDLIKEELSNLKGELDFYAIGEDSPEPNDKNTVIINYIYNHSVLYVQFKYDKLSSAELIRKLKQFKETTRDMQKIYRVKKNK